MDFAIPADQDVQTVIELGAAAAPAQVIARPPPERWKRSCTRMFSEFGASGRRWGAKPSMIAALAAEQPGGEEPGAEAAGLITATEIAGTRLADDVIHLTYVSQRGGPPRPRAAPSGSGPKTAGASTSTRAR